MSGEVQEDIRGMMAEAGYSEKAITYVLKGEQLGTLENPDQVTTVKGPCGDTMKISLKLNGNKIKDAKIEVLGCPGAVASACAVIELAKDKRLEEAEAIDLEALYKQVEKLPDQKLHCAKLALMTLKKAIREYREKRDKKAHETSQKH
ncbi:MAG TPA: iron-sulfur cluster assembly scaffold protein [Desulfobacterales bacterium]|nr:iron-sulfur cluster assembly scaffold protein [Desulfobacterales bacterium]